ncbi:DUF6882 domain-containing protein [Streptacidiphilus sp. MAP5-3]|uniref:DUF6882 domain-containing protein n=1 Tax=unclassified Streptacidiphilus TaxID=2643834 RepID=UPI003513F918
MKSIFSEAFLRHAEYHAAWGTEQLDALGRALPAGGEWTADLEQQVYRAAGRTVRVGLLGTFDVTGRSWLWAWANPSLRGTPVVVASERVAEFGKRNRIPELREAGVDLSGFDDPRWAAEALAFVAMGVLSAPGYIGQSAGSDTRVYFTPDDPQIQLAPLDPIAMPRFLMTGQTLFSRSARQVVRGYFAHHGIRAEKTIDGTRAHLPDGSTVQVTFDPLGRIANISAGARTS